MLEIKDRIMMGNGCSILSTIGMRRFKVLVRKEHDGYDMATVQYIQDEKVPPKKLVGQYNIFLTKRVIIIIILYVASVVELCFWFKKTHRWRRICASAPRHHDKTIII